MKIKIAFFISTLLLGGCNFLSPLNNNQQTEISAIRSVVENDQTKDIQSALNARDTLFLKEGIYIISHLDIPANKVIKTAGFKTILKQKKNYIQSAFYDKDKSIIAILGSNVVIDSISCEGNIDSTYMGEQNHGLLILATDKNIENVFLKGLNVNNVHGDGVCIATYNRNCFPKNIIANNIIINNCYRNGVSISAGIDITLRNIYTAKVGMTGIDLEGDKETPAPIKNINIQDAQLAGLAITGQGVIAQDITITNVKIDGLLRGSIPMYPQNFLCEGLALYKAKNILVDKIHIENIPCYGVKFYAENEGEHIDCIIKNMVMKNTSTNKKQTDGYIFTSGAQNVTFDNLEINTEQNRPVFYQQDSAARQVIKLKNAGHLSKLSKNSKIQKLN